MKGSRFVVTREAQAESRRHELAHCNGWPGDHPKEVKQVKQATPVASTVAAKSAVPLAPIVVLSHPALAPAPLPWPLDVGEGK
jgi:hypothetical protein